MTNNNEITINLVRQEKPRSSKPRVYFHHDGETVLENLHKRRGRPVWDYRALLPKVFDMVQDQIDISFDKVEHRWSQKAGCSCGCSPGFILSGAETLWHDIHVTILPPFNAAEFEAQLLEGHS